MSAAAYIVVAVAAMLGAGVGWLLRGRRSEVEIGEAVFEQWTRAHCPPFDWFCRLPETVRGALARIGDRYEQDRAVAVGYAVANPQAADAAVHPDDRQAEERMLTQVAEQAASIASGQRQAPSAPTMAGLGQRRQDAAEAAAAATPRPRFMGRVAQ